MKVLDFTIGADPEVFVKSNNVGNIQNIPASLVTTGTKEKPETFQNGISVHADNVCLEFNIPPARDKDSFVSSINCAKTVIQDMVGPDRRMVATPATVFLSRELEQGGEAATLERCHPDKFCWGERAEPYQSLEHWRVAGGHVHMGWGGTIDPLDQLKMARACDYFIGLRCVLYENTHVAAKRRMYYGGAGSFRETLYGIEYRTPSNFWIEKAELIEKMYDWTFQAVHEMDKWEEFVKIIPPAAVERCINKGSKASAEGYLKALELTG